MDRRPLQAPAPMSQQSVDELRLQQSLERLDDVITEERKRHYAPSQAASDARETVARKALQANHQLPGAAQHVAEAALLIVLWLYLDQLLVRPLDRLLLLGLRRQMVETAQDLFLYRVVRPYAEHILVVQQVQLLELLFRHDVLVGILGHGRPLLGALQR